MSASLKLWMVSARRATDPEAMITASWNAEVIRSALNEIFTARIPRSEDSSAESIESAASWLWGAKIARTAPFRPRGWAWVCSWLPFSCGAASWS